MIVADQIQIFKQSLSSHRQITQIMVTNINFSLMLSVVRLRGWWLMFYECIWVKIMFCWLVTLPWCHTHHLYTCFRSCYSKNHSTRECCVQCHLENNKKSSCEMFVVLSQGKCWGGKYKHLQLVEKLSLEVLFVLGTDKKHQCKCWASQANKQANIDCSYVCLYVPYGPAVHAKQVKQH